MNMSPIEYTDKFGHRLFLIFSLGEMCCALPTLAHRGELNDDYNEGNEVCKDEDWEWGKEREEDCGIWSGIIWEWSGVNYKDVCLIFNDKMKRLCRVD